MDLSKVANDRVATNVRVGIVGREPMRYLLQAFANSVFATIESQYRWSTYYIKDTFQPTNVIKDMMCLKKISISIVLYARDAHWFWCPSFSGSWVYIPCSSFKKGYVAVI